MAPKRGAAAASAPVVRSPLAKRSRHAAPTLSRPCCVRCAQYILTDPVPCDMTEAKRCARCAGLHKHCVPIPEHSIVAVNGVMDAYDALAVGDAPDDALVQQCATMNKELRALEKKRKKEGGTAKPKSTQDAVMVLVKEVRKANQLFTHFLDSYRSVNGLEALASDSDSE